MEETAEERKLPLIKIALFGPSNSGKTTFLLTFLGRPSEELSPTTEAKSYEIQRTFYRKMEGKKVPLEVYRLMIVDLPGKEGYDNIRVLSLAKCVGIILFYDATDPISAQMLHRMVDEEIVGGGFIPNLLGIVIVGTKKDLGVNVEAIKIGEKLADSLTNEIKSYWNYEVPHLIINALNQEEVRTVLNILEHLFISLTAPRDLIESLSAKRYIAALPAKVVIKKAETPEIKALERTEVIEEIEVPAIERIREVKYLIYPVDRIWEILKSLGSRFPEIEFILLARKAAEGAIYVAFYPGEKSEENIPEELVNTVLSLDNVIAELLRMEDVGDLSHIILHGTKRSIIMLRKKVGILAIKTKEKPSEELLNLLTK